MEKIPCKMDDAYGRILSNYYLVALILWTLLILIMGGLDFYHSRKEVVEDAITLARHKMANDLLFRRWVSEHGGVYVPASKESPPNPNLAHIPERDIITPSGRALTLLNHSSAYRQIHELGTKERGIQGRLTSLRPLSPENAPDLWEEKALCILSGGEKEYLELTRIGEEPYLRLINPIVMEPSCRKCHSADGDLPGGLSISVPWQPYKESLIKLTPVHLIGYGAIWSIGILGLGLTRLRLNRHFKEQLRMDENLRRSEEKYRLLAEGIAAIPWEFDLTIDHWTYVGPQAETMLGFAQEEWTDLAFWTSRIHEDDREQAVDFCRIQTQRGMDHDFEYRFVKKDGGIAWIRDVVSVELVAGVPVRLRGVMIDLTGHRQTEERLRQASKMEAVGTLAAGVAHDFNNILTSLVSFATLAKRRHKDDPTTSDYLKEILEGAHRAAELTRGLLAYSRKQETRMRLEELNEIIAHHQKMLRRLIRADIEFKVARVTAMLPFMGDRAQIEQVLMNLVVNAQDAMPDGGSIGIEATLLRDEHRQRFPALKGFTGNAWALLLVSDTGAGIAPEFQEKIFDPFFTTKEVGKGTGLGLAMVQGIIRQHGGQIAVNSRPGQGATFLITLPLTEKVERSPVLDEEEGEELEGKGESILLAEDEPQVRLGLKHLLEKKNYKVFAAMNGEEAVDIFRQRRGELALVILDLLMPGKNGRQALEEMRALAPETRVLFISGYSGQVLDDGGLGDRENLMEKPLDMTKFLREIRRILER